MSLENLMALTEIDPNSGCWLWSGRLRANHRGWAYGSISVAGKNWSAHRYSYTLLRGPIPDGLVIDHLCRTPLCVNPAHMEPVTSRENTRRGQVGSNHRNKTHCKNGHAFSGSNLYIYASGIRSCRQCKTDSKRRRTLERLADRVGRATLHYCLGPGIPVCGAAHRPGNAIRKPAFVNCTACLNFLSAAK